MKIKCRSFKLLLLLPVFFLMTNCQEEDVVISEKNVSSSNGNEISSKIISLDDLKVMTEFKNIYIGSVRKSKDSLIKIYSEKYKFWVEKDRVLLTSKGDYHSFSFPVFRSEPSEKLENLFLHPYNGKYLPYLIRYNFTKVDMDALSKGNVISDIESKIEIMPILNFDLNDIGLPMSEFENFAFDPGEPFWYNGKCSTWGHSFEENGVTYTEILDCLNCGCPKQTSGGGGGSYSGGAGIIMTDFRGYYGLEAMPSGGYSSGGGGGGGNPNYGGDQGYGGIFNPSSGIIPDNGGNTVGVPNGNPVIGIVGPDAPISNKAPGAQAIENQIDTSGLDDCSAEVVEQLKSLTDVDIAKMITKLDANPSPYKLEIKVESNGVSSPANTSRTVGFVKYNYTIRLNPNNFGPNANPRANKLFTATTVVHEIVHAYLLSLIDDVKVGVQGSSEEMSELFSAYVTKTFGPNSEMIHHQIMADKFVDAIGRTIQEYYTGVPVQSEPVQLFKDLAWGSLQHAPVFQTLPIADQNRINYRYLAEARGEVRGGQEPIGEPCN